MEEKINQQAEEETVKKDLKEKNVSSLKYLGVFSVTVIAILGVILFITNYFEPPQIGYEKVSYNLFDFIKTSTHWNTRWQAPDNQIYRLSFRYNPLEVEDIQIKGELNKTFDALKPIHVAFDPLTEDANFKYLTLGAAELTLNMKVLNKPFVAACTQNETDACINRPIVECGKFGKSVILLKTEGPTQILLNNTCIILQGEDFDLIKSIDRLLYHWYRIIK
ncbi:hypothetical protein HYV79_03980 [Candidatus Woesearchaeota archaeon]|nr:hypothetical protein [Candidatus Woesearchaeota archaeon]